ncbi:class I SAM-dependent methyltransferase [Thermodesulfobacteriota bacterium]
MKNKIFRNNSKYYDKQNNRIIFLIQKAHNEFWDKHWAAIDLEKSITSISKFDFVSRVTKKYLHPTNGPILEGGCGIGRNVFALIKNGFSCIGVDNAKKTVARVNEVMPDIDVRYGDVRKLDFIDSYFAGYWSAGVIEHFWNGYDETLFEMRRVLRNGGYLFLAFPCMSLLRILKCRIRCFQDFQGADDLMGFYQFALDEKRVIKDLKNFSFHLINKTYFGGLKGFKDEVALFHRILQRLIDYNGDAIPVKGIRVMLDKALSALGANHMILMIFKLKK